MTMYEELKELREQLTKDEECIINHGREFTAVYRRLDALEAAQRVTLRREPDGAMRVEYNSAQPQVALRPLKIWDEPTCELVRAAREVIAVYGAQVGQSQLCDALRATLKHFEAIE